MKDSSTNRIKGALDPNEAVAASRAFRCEGGAMNIEREIEELQALSDELLHLVNIGSLRKLSRKEIPAIIIKDVAQLLFNMDSIGTNIETLLREEMEQVASGDPDYKPSECNPELMGWYKAEYKLCADNLKKLAVSFMKDSDIKNLDYAEYAVAKKMEKSLPKAWEKMLSNCDHDLVKLLQKEVKLVSGLNIDARIAVEFIKRKASDST